jgi:hypothetical protein
MSPCFRNRAERILWMKLLPSGKFLLSARKVAVVKEVEAALERGWR